MSAAGLASDAPLAGQRIFMMLLNAPFYGSERLMVQTAATLSQLGASVLVATCDWEFGGIRRELQRRQVPYVDILMRGMFTRRGGVRRVVRVVLEALRSSWRVRRAAHAFGPTHIIIPDESNFLYAVPLLLAPRGASAVFAPANVPDQQKAARSRLYRLFLKKVIGGLTSAVVANSRFTAAALRRYLPPDAAISVVPCCLPAREGEGRDGALDIVARDRFNVVFVGQLAAHKGIDPLIDAAIAVVHKHPHVDFILAGPGDDRAPDEARWRARVHEHGLDDRIRFIGPVRDVPQLLSMASVHVMPSLVDESFGLVVLEAKHAGVPSVVFPAGALPELIQHKVDGFVCGGASPDDLVEGLRYFIEDAHGLSQARRAALASAAAYSNAQFALRWTQLLTQTGRA